MESRRFNIALALTSGILLGASFPPLPLYSAAYVALVPFLFLMDRLESTKQVIRYSYLTMFVFNAGTLYWVGGFTHLRDGYLMASGILLLICHPMFFWIPILSAYAIRRRMGEFGFLIALPLFWVSFEYFHAHTEFAFPWVTLGNSQAYDLGRSQIAEFTSVYGLSFLILAFNVLSFFFIKQLVVKTWSFSSRPALIALSVLVMIYFVPSFYGGWKMRDVEQRGIEKTVGAGIIQPNIDPFEKWGQGSRSRWESYQEQVEILLKGTRELSGDSLDLVVWPETAIPYYILLPQNMMYWNQVKHEIDFANVAVFTGIPHAEYFDSVHAPSTSEWDQSSRTFFEGYNAATLIQPYSPPGPVYKKVILVPFAERVPYAERLKFLIKPLKWSVGISGWGKGEEAVVFELKMHQGSPVKFGGMVCYESIYPHYVRQFVVGGAEFLVIITNDSWWGKTSGAYQHAAFASFRAIENRRWIVRCANGGISGFIDPVGRFYNATDLYTSEIVRQDIGASSFQTFYARAGDVFALTCLAGSVVVIIFAITRRKRG